MFSGSHPAKKFLRDVGLKLADTLPGGTERNCALLSCWLLLKTLHSCSTPFWRAWR
ncbi:hypothetical protein, partial [Klebsiella pneumoniae]